MGPQSYSYCLSACRVSHTATGAPAVPVPPARVWAHVPLIVMG